MDFSLKDRLGQTAFVIAMNCRDNEASAAILAREPSAAEQVCIQYLKNRNRQTNPSFYILRNKIDNSVRDSR